MNADIQVGYAYAPPLAYVIQCSGRYLKRTHTSVLYYACIRATVTAPFAVRLSHYIASRKGEVTSCLNGRSDIVAMTRVSARLSSPSLDHFSCTSNFEPTPPPPSQCFAVLVLFLPVFPFVSSVLQVWTTLPSFLPPLLMPR